MAIKMRSDFFLEDFSPLSQALIRAHADQLVMFTLPSRMRSVLGALTLRLLRDMGMLEYRLL